MARIAFVLTALQLGASAATFVQQVFVARVVGANEQSDGYQIALALVLLLHGLITGALVNAFVPELAALARDDIDRARSYAFSAQVNILAVACLVTILLWIVTPTIVDVTVAGLSPLARSWAVVSLQIMVIATPFVALSAMYTASLYAAGDLKYVALSLIVQNSVAAVVSVVGYFLIGFTALPISMVIGASAGCIILFVRLHRRALTPSRQRRFATVSSATILMATAIPLAAPVVGAVPGFVERWFMSYFPVGQIAILAYAGRIFSVALAFGVSVGVVTLSRWSGGERSDRGRDGGEATSRSAVTAVLFMLLPPTVALMLVPDVVVQALFGDSAMDRSQLATMAILLSIYSLSLVPMALIGVILRGFYAVGKPNSALMATVVWVFLWVAFDVVLVPQYGIFGLAVASVSAVWLSLIIVLLRWRVEGWLAVWPAVILSRETFVIGIASVTSMAIASAVMRTVALPWALAILPVVLAAYVVIAAVGGSSLARDVLGFVVRRRTLR